MQRLRVRNRPLFVMAVLAGFAAIFLPFLSHAPNRLVSGQPISVLTLDLPGLALLLSIGLLAVGALLPQSRRLLNAVVLVSSVLLIMALFVAGKEANRLSGTSLATARTSLGASFWIMLSTATLIIADTLSRAGHRVSVRALIFGAVVLAGVIMASAGHLDQLSVMKEYVNKADIFQRAVLQHMAIVAGALLPTLLLGIPLGVLAFRSQGVGKGLLAALNVIQTIPSIALFGLLMAPLSALAFAVPWFRSVGISGIGLAPAIIALTLYCLLPIVRNTCEGLAQVPRHVVEAARGMGMTDRQILAQVQVPLALPVFLSGLRVTLIQAIGLAAVAALIGAGGLGSIMFQGLFSNALDLVLLGTVPIVMMVVVVDVLFKSGINYMFRHIR